MQTKIPNDGVSKVVRPETQQQWEVLEWELRSFVCEGEYARGLERILDSFLRNLGQAQQPAVWVSGFYGSGKSHLCRVLEYLWRDVTLPSGESARSVVNLPHEIDAHFRELSTEGKRQGGLWSAAGTLGAGKSQAVRLAFLSVLFDGAGLPQQYPHARFAIWAKDNGYLDRVVAAVEAEGKSFEHEVHNLYVSPIIAKALLEEDPTLGESVKDVRGLLQAQFPARIEDISDEEMFEAIEDVLRLQSDTEGRYPLTLIVLDEMQQYLGDDNTKTLAVQNIVEGVTARFDNAVIFVGTGQSAMGGTPTLQKLTDRFPVHVHLSDKDVETVVRQVILRKKPDRRAELESVLEDVSGEIDRHLGGTKIAPVTADKQDLVADYPLLPTRRRFWELALRALDKAGKAGVLRTQLRIVHEATREVAEEPAGYVVGADFLYHQQAPTLQQSGELLKEISESILALKDEGGPAGELKSRICALVFLITEIPAQMIGTGDTGLRATAPYIADLLVEDLPHGGAQIRKRVPELLDELTEAGRLMRIDDEYRLQTEEGAEWEKDYRTRLTATRDEPGKLATLRNERLLRAVDEALVGLRLTHGQSKTHRKVVPHYGTDEPTADEGDIPVWVRDEWTVTESAVKNAAAQAGDADPVVHVLLPKRDAETIKDALASYAAAQETLHSKPTPQTDEGKQAQRAMKGRVAAEEDRLTSLFQEVVANARVYQGGGNEVNAPTLREAVEIAAQRSLVRLFPKFDVADDANWGKVVNKARDGAPDALQAVGYAGEVPAHPVCKEVLAAISAAGTKGTEIRARFSSPPYGWDENAVRGALMVLLATRHIRAAQDGVALSGPKQLEPRQIGKTTFYKEEEPPTTSQRMAVRGLLATADIPYENSQEQTQIPALLQKLLDLASDAGGAPPLPEPPDTSHIEALQSLAGNQQFREVADDHEQLKKNLNDWRAAARRREERQKEWAALEALLHHGRELDVTAEIAAQQDAIRDDRQLLDDPDPVRPLLDAITDPLREAVTAAAEQLRSHHDEVIADLEASDEWRHLGDDDWAEIIAEVGLQRPGDIDVSTQDKLLAVLNDAPLSSWKDRTEVVRARAKRARELAAKKLEPEAVRVTLDSATLKSKDDANSYIADVRQRIMQHIDDGHTVII
ncbi:MAG: BREX system P-loop protein BrxC [Actinobacteria bacterium]|nr:BREX system P-loop protein BrxC [Actinomycetota bacterium]